MSRIVNRLEEGTIAFLLAGMAILTFIQVVLRYAFNTGFIWALEAVTYMFGWMVLLGISYCVKMGAHIGVDAVIRLLPANGRRVAGVIGGLLCLGYAAILFVGGWNYVSQLHTIGVEAEDLPIQRWLLFTALPLGFALLFVRLVQATWRIANGRQSGLVLSDEATETLEHFEGEIGRGRDPAP